MIKNLAALFITVSFTMVVSAQELKENKIDEFTRNNVKRTSWEPLSKSGKLYVHARTSKINDAYFLDLKIMLGSAMNIGGTIFSITDGPNIMFKMGTDSVLSLVNPKYEVSCQGCGAINIIGSEGYGVHLSIPIDQNQFDYLFKNKVKKIRIYTTDGYTETDIKEKFEDIIIKELLLVK